jgi:protein ImuB
MPDAQPAAMSDLFACLYQPPGPASEPLPDAAARAAGLRAIALDFSPRFEMDRDDLVSIDVRGLARLLGTPQTIGEELRRAAADRGLRVHVAVAGTRTAALVLAQARPGLTVVPRGEEAAALAPIPIGVLGILLSDSVTGPDQRRSVLNTREGHGPSVSGAGVGPRASKESGPLPVFKSWGLRTLGDLAALPASGLVSRIGRAALAWQAMARGEDIRPLVPALEQERFESSLELEWPIEGLEPLSFVLTRLLEPIATRLERRDRGAAVLHVLLRLVTRETCARRLELPTPMRDVRTLRTLALLDLESHPAAAAIDCVTIVVDPTPGRVLQHTLFTRPHPTPEQLSTLIARLDAVMGQGRVGAPATVDSYRPGAFAMKGFQSERESLRSSARDREAASAREGGAPAISALRRCRHPVPARVVVQDERPVRVTTDRRGFTGGAVTRCAGPWRVSGEWWESQVGQAGQVGHVNRGELRRSVLDTREGSACGSSERERASKASGDGTPRESKQSNRCLSAAFNRDEWEVALGDGGVYCIFRDRETDSWFIDAIVD